MAEDHVDLDAQQVANGLGKWDQVAGTLQSRWNDLTGQIDALLTPETWGADGPGSNFNASFMEDGQAGKFTENGQQVVKSVQEAGQNVRKSAEASLSADQQQAAEVGGVKVPGFNTGAGSGGR